MQYRSGLLSSFLARTGLDFTPFPNPDLSQGLMAAAGGRAGRFLDVDFRPGV
jgi:hypothetical protein